MEFHHIGVVVRRIDAGKQIVSGILGISEWTDTIDDPLHEVQVCFGLDASGVRYELITPTTASSPVARVLKEGVNVVNHVAYLVPDLAVAAERLRHARCAPIGEAKPGAAFNNKPAQFFITPVRMLIELIEK